MHCRVLPDSDTGNRSGWLWIRSLQQHEQRGSSHEAKHLEQGDFEDECGGDQATHESRADLTPVVALSHEVEGGRRLGINEG